MNEQAILNEWNRNIAHLYKQLSKNNKRPYNGGTTSNSELELLGKQFIGSKFIGVFAVDSKINLGKLKQVYFIINNDKIGQPGQHWISVVKSNNNLYVHDTFGRPSKKLIKVFYDKMYGSGYNIKDTDNDKEQGPYQMDCGIRAVSSLMIAKKHGVKSFLKL